MFFKKKKLKKQEALFTEALTEAGYDIRPGDVTIDHPKGQCRYKTETYSIVFPLRFLRESRKLDFSKTLDFCFRGLNNTRRDWVKKFNSDTSRITFTDNGRTIAKDFFDVSYYQEMASSKFTLCPAGDFQWTYRFLEAIMCQSIPVIDVGCGHEHFDGFTFFYADKNPKELRSMWKEDLIKQNYNIFLKRHTLLNKYIFFPQ